MPPQNVFAGRIENDQLDVALLAERVDPRGQLGEHPLVQQVVFGAIEREPRDFAFDAHLHELEIVDLRRDQRQRSEDFYSAARLWDIKSLRCCQP